MTWPRREQIEVFYSDNDFHDDFIQVDDFFPIQNTLKNDKWHLAHRTVI